MITKREILRKLALMERFGVESTQGSRLERELILNTLLARRTLMNLLDLAKNPIIPQSIKDAAFSQKFYNTDNLVGFYNEFEYEDIIPYIFYWQEDFLNRTGISWLPDELLRKDKWIEHIYCPSQIREVGRYAFAESSIKSFKRAGEGELIIKEGAFYNCENLSSVVLPIGTTRIGAGAFAGCTALTEIKIPDTVSKIGSYSFLGCVELERVIISASNTLRINSNIIAGCPKVEIAVSDF